MITAILAALKLKAVLGWAAEHWQALALAALVAAIPIGYMIGHHKGDTAGYQRYAAQVAVANAKAEAERTKDNETLRNSTDYDLCVSYLRGRRLPVDPCEQLRGLQP